MERNATPVLTSSLYCEPESKDWESYEGTKGGVVLKDTEYYTKETVPQTGSFSLDLFAYQPIPLIATKPISFFAGVQIFPD